MYEDDTEQSERAQLRQARKRENLRQAQIDKAVSALMQHGDGIEFLWWMLEISGVGRQPYRQHALSMSFECGKLDVGNMLMARIMRVNPEAYINILKEKNDGRTRTDSDTGTDTYTDSGADSDA